MWLNHRHHYSCWFFKDIYLPLSMPQNIMWNFWCLNLWYFEWVYVEHAKHASSVLCEDASTSPECLYILTLLCLFLWKLKINNFWKSLAFANLTTVPFERKLMTWFLWQMSKECIRTVETKPNIFPQINGIGEKVKSVMVALRADRLPQKLRALVSCVRVHILSKYCNSFVCVYRNLQVCSVPAVFCTFLLPEEEYLVWW